MSQVHNIILDPLLAHSLTKIAKNSNLKYINFVSDYISWYFYMDL